MREQENKLRKNNKIMKKHIVIILLLLIAIGAKAQIVSTNSNEGGTYFFSSNGSGQMNTQKILKYDSISHIILTQTVSTNQSRFCLVEQGNIYTKYVDVPDPNLRKKLTIGLSDTDDPEIRAMKKE